MNKIENWDSPFADLIPEERRNAVLKFIKDKGGANVSALSKMLFINEATIRRDLNELARLGLIKRTYGGAVPVSGPDSEIPLFVRETEFKAQKETIGLLAAQFVSDGDTIMLDSSSTTAHIIPGLIPKKGLKIVTNGAKTAILLSQLSGAKIYCTGGMLRENSLSFIGPAAASSIENLHFDSAFFSCRGVSLENGLTDLSEDEAHLRRLMIKHSKRSYLLAVSEKLGSVSFSRISGLESISGIVTEKRPSPEWRAGLGNKLYYDISK